MFSMKENSMAFLFGMWWWKIGYRSNIMMSTQIGISAEALQNNHLIAQFIHTNACDYSNIGMQIIQKKKKITKSSMEEFKNTDDTVKPSCSHCCCLASGKARHRQKVWTSRETHILRGFRCCAADDHNDSPMIFCNLFFFSFQWLSAQFRTHTIRRTEFSIRIFAPCVAGFYLL